ncbi:hypothetical protein FHX74_000871 [Friedmanniella endophytica]|uniref:Ig-like domain (Group 3) n=1 Tax=Microlunatus kandeliicorticis TaxID=1759536 RepID=A0A7W3IQB7_9ACTN|nr:Ig-like domain-containing protein [Microlunatus kandeliicorticis]MBA8793277.1 hypothetical protein [Microlunatus kandeliicorticis]
MRRLVNAFLCSLLVLGTVLGLLGTGASRAVAAPLPAAFTGSAGGTVANVSVTTAGLNLAGVRLADTAASADSGASPRTSAVSRNLGATVAGLGVAVDSNSQTAPPDNTDASTSNLAAVNALGIGASALTASDLARWTGDASCVPDQLSNAYVRTGGVTVNPSIAGISLGAPVLTTGAGTTRGITSLVGAGLNKAVRGSVTGGVTGVNVLGAVGIDIADTTLSATADGSTGAAGFAFTPNTISYTYQGTTRTLAAGTSTTITLGTVLAGQQVITLTANNPTTTGNGRSASTAVTVLSIGITVKAPATGTTLATVGVDLLPLRAAATAPVGGIDCPPAAPVLTGPGNGTTTNDSTPEITGTGTPGASVNVTVDGTVRSAVTTVGNDGTWSWSPTTPLADGSHTISATQTVNGAVSPSSGNRSFTIDATAPARPVITAPTDGSLLATRRPTVQGAAEAGSSVVVRVDGTSVGSTTATGAGTFSLVPNTDLADGSHTITAQATDTAGNTSATSAGVTVQVDATAPAAPVLTTPANGVSTRDATPVISGTAEAGSTVTATVDGTALTTTATAGSGGAYALTAPTLSEGSHTVFVTATDAAGNVSAASATHTFSVDRTAPAAPVITATADGSVINTALPTITGSGENGAIVTVSIDGTVAGGATVSGGAWSLTLSTPLTDGPHTVTAVQTDAAGNTSTIATAQFGVDTATPAAPLITAPANGALVRGPDITLVGTGEAGASVTVQRSGGGSYGPVTVTSAGTWSVPVTGLSDGSATFTARQTDAAGNQSAASATVTLTVTTSGPVPPVITAPATGAVTANPSVTVQGTGVAGATVTLYEGSATVLGTATVSSGGTWTLTRTFADGPHSLYATQDQGVGSSPASAVVIISIDTVAPAVPVVVSPANGTVTADRTPIVAGTGEPGARVTVTVGGTTLPVVTVLGDGTWSAPVTAPLADAVYTVTAVQRDAAGNASPTATSTFEVLASAPPAPGVDTPADGAVVGTTTPALGGTGETGDTVLVSVDGVAVGSAPVANGRWSLTLATPLAQGTHQLSVTQRGRSGLLSTATDTAFVVDTVAPDAPVLTAPADNAVLSVTTVTVRGTAEPNSTVTVSLNGGTAGTAQANGAGIWSLTTATLAEGSYTVTATAQDAAGNTSVASVGRTFTIDRTAPAAPLLTSPSAGAVINDPTPLLTGSGEPGATVAVSVDGGAPQTALVDVNGLWQLTVSPALIDGAHTLTLLQTDRAGNVSVGRNVTLTVDTQAPATPVITAPTEGAILTGPDATVTGTGEPGSTLALTLDGTAQPPVVVPGNGIWSVALTGLSPTAHTVSATLTDAAQNVSNAATRSFEIAPTAPAAPVITVPTAGALVGDATPTVSGTGVDGATVTVRVDGTVVGTATVAGTAWSLGLTDPLADGPHTATATQAVGIVDSGESTPVSFTVDATPPVAPVVTTPADGTVVADDTPTITGTGETGSTVTVYIDNAPQGSAPVTNGSWTFTPTLALTAGPHLISATQTDAAGNVSDPSTSVRITVDTDAPAAPVITGPANGGAVNDPTPDVTGTGQPGATVVVTVDGGAQVTTTVGTDGRWSVTLPTLADGPHTAVASLTGTNGLPAVGTASVAFTVDTVSPSAPVIVTPPTGAVLGTATPTITGTGEPAATVTVKDGSRTLGTAVVNDQGNWSLVSAPLAEGQHVLTATQTDRAGNPSSVSSAHPVSVDLTAPAAPSIGTPPNGAELPVGPVTISGTGEPGASLVLLVNGAPLAPVTVNDQGGWTATLTNPATAPYTVSATQTDAAGNRSPASPTVSFTVSTTPRPSAPVITVPADGSTTTDRTPTISGTATAGATVAVTLDGTLIDTVTAGSTGAWSVDVTATQPYGQHVIAATQTVGARTSSPASSTVTVLPVGGRLPAPVITTPATRYRTTPVTAISGTGEPGAQVSVTVDGGSSPRGTVTVGGNGIWTLTVDPALGEGTHTIAATQAVFGLPATASDPARATVTVDSRALAPVITSPRNNTEITDATPTVTGTAEPGARVTLYTNGGSPRTVTANATTGAWSLTLPTQKDGKLAFTASQVDLAGNVSPRSGTVTVTLRTVALPVVVAPKVTSTSTRLLVIGTGQPKASIRLTVTSGSKVVKVGPATVGSTRQWFLVTPVLAGGTWKVQAAQSISGKPTLSSNTTTVKIIGSTSATKPKITSPKTEVSVSSNKLTMSGTGAKGTRIGIIGTGGRFYGIGTVNSSGKWSIPITLRPGTTLFNAVQINKDSSEIISPTITVRLKSR